MKKMIVAVVILSLLVGGGIGNVSASSWWGNMDARMDNGVAVIGGNTQGSVDTSEKGIWDTYFPEQTPTPTPVRCRYDKYPYNCNDWLICSY